MNFKNLFFITLLSTHPAIQSLEIELSEKEMSPQQKELHISFQLAPHEKILKQTLNVSSDSPNATLSPLSFSEQSTKQYLPEFKDSKEIFNQDFTISTTATCQTSDHVKTNIYISYLSLPNNKTEEKRFELYWNLHQSTDETDSKSVKKYLHSEPKAHKSYLESFQNLVQTTQNRWLRILFAFLLGLLLSLTPCIYPMIPITIGILHRNGKKSLAYNLLGSICYAIGLSTTFAIFGLLAALAGASFGGLLSQPVFVVILTLFIGYMSLTMIGVVDLKIPSFMRGNSTMNSAFGPFLSAFFFGLLSGSIASPCVSPGLALLLTVVATIGNIFAGFLLLFSFGIGMSVPLILIGTFSTSLQMLPQAGQWMVEIKKALGFIMLATCFYYLNNILPASIIAWLFIGYLLFAAFFYIIDAQNSFDKQTRTIKSLIGIVLLAAAIFTGYRTYNTKTITSEQEHGVIWASDYASGYAQAKEENKLLLLDFWAQHCTICKAIDKKIFKKDFVAQELEKDIVFVKVDCSSSHNHEANELKHTYSVFGQPAILIINPQDKSVLKQWSSEPYNMTPQEFAQLIKTIKA